jgi:hypothetical protein
LSGTEMFHYESLQSFFIWLLPKCSWGVC